MDKRIKGGDWKWGEKRTRKEGKKGNVRMKD